MLSRKIRYLLQDSKIKVMQVNNRRAERSLEDMGKRIKIYLIRTHFYIKIDLYYTNEILQSVLSQIDLILWEQFMMTEYLNSIHLKFRK